MNKKTILALVIIIVVIALFISLTLALIPDTTSPTTTNQDTINDTSNSTETSKTIVATITATNDGLSPITITVKKGDTIKVVNNSSSTIEFSSADHPTHLANSELNQSALAPGDSQTFAISTAGTHGYHDHLDDSHTGTIIVTE